MLRKKEIQKLFGKVVRKQRKFLKITQLELAERSSLDNTYISQIERGLKNPSIYSFHKIANSLELSEKELFQKMSDEANKDTTSKLKPVEDLEIIYSAIVKLNAGLLLTSTQDNGYRIIYCNDEFLELSKFKREDIIGKKLVDILNDGKNDDELVEFLTQIRNKNTTQELTTGSINNGKSKPLEINTTTVLDGNREVEKHLFIIKKEIYKISSDRILSETVEKFESIISESNNRIKNNLSIIAGIIDLKIQNSDIENTTDILRDTQARISAIAHIHELLTISEDHSKLKIQEYINKLTAVIKNTYDFENEVDIETKIEVDDVGVDKMISLGLLSNELITNSYKHAFDTKNEGKINLSLYENNEGELIFSYKDNGNSYEEEKFLKGGTIGHDLINALMVQLQAEHIKFSPAEGFKLEFKMNTLEYKELSEEKA
jgi:PAS domain S-box-containing protein